MRTLPIFSGLLLLAFSLGFISCSDDDSEGIIVAGGKSYTPNPFAPNNVEKRKFVDKDLLTIRNDLYVNDTLYSAYFDRLPDCAKDDISIFYGNGTLEKMDNGTKCNPTSPPDYDSWIMDDSGKTISIAIRTSGFLDTFVYDIIKNDGNEFTIAFTGDSLDFGSDGTIDKISYYTTYKVQ